MKKSAYICGLLLVLFLPLIGHAQDDEVVRVKSNLVNIDVVVKDKKGKYVSDLKPEDFVITENGQPQKIEFFDAPLSKTETRKPNETGTTATTTTTGTPPTAPRHYVSLVLDSQTTDLTNLKQLREGAIKYVREQVTEADAVAILSVTNGLQMLQPFTRDKAKLIATLENLGGISGARNAEIKEVNENIASLRDFLNNSPSPSDISSASAGSAMASVLIAQTVLQQFIRMRTALSVQQARPVLAALAAIAEGLRRIPGKKTLVLFSQGFVTPAVLDWQPRAYRHEPRHVAARAEGDHRKLHGVSQPTTAPPTGSGSPLRVGVLGAARVVP